MGTGKAGDCGLRSREQDGSWALSTDFEVTSTRCRLYVQVKLRRPQMRIAIHYGLALPNLPKQVLQGDFDPSWPPPGRSQSEPCKSE